MKFLHSRLAQFFLTFVGLLIAEHSLWVYAMHLYDCDYAYVDTHGELVLEGYCSAGPFYDGLAVVRLNADSYGSSAVIDTNGKVLFEIDSDVVSHFSEGLIAVKERESDGTIGLGGYLNEKGETVIDFQFGDENHYGLTDFSEGLAAVYDPSSKDWGYIDATGTFVIPPQFNEAEPFQNGLASVTTWSKETAYVRGLIDVKGEWISDVVPLDALPEFLPALTLVEVGDRKLFLDEKGDTVMDVSQYDLVLPFSEALSGVCQFSEYSWQNRCGFIDESGNLVIPMAFEKITANFSGGLAVVESLKPLWARVLYRFHAVLTSPDFN